MKECKEVISEEMIYSLNQLQVNWKKQQFTDEQNKQLTYCAHELKHLSRQDLGRFQTQLTQKLNKADLQPYLDHLDAKVHARFANKN